MAIGPQAFRFLLSALAGISFGLFWAWFFHEQVGWSAELAVALSIVLVSIQNFLVFLFWVYKPTERKSLRSMIVGFVLSVAAFRGIEYLLFLLFHTVLHLHYLLVLIGLRSGLMVVKFFFYRKTLFADRKVAVTA